MDAVERLSALREIDDLIGRYCILFDDQQWDAFSELWTDDAAFVVDGVAFEGRDTVLEFLTTCLPAGYQSKHVISPPVVELAADGSHATAKTDVVWIAQNFENAIVARYDDELVRDGERRRNRHRCRTTRCASAGRRCAAEQLDQGIQPTGVATMTVVFPDRPELEALVGTDAELTEIGSGYVFSEGPVWSVAEQALYFSDIPGDKRFRWTESAGMELVMEPTFKANGMAFDVEGRLIVCEHVSSSITRFHPDGFRETVCFHHGGVYLNSPNDLVACARDGSIYFTDPDYGRWNDWIGSQRTPLLGFKGVFRVPHEGGEAQLVVERDEFEQPNGLCFSPDESLMYVNDSPRAEIKVFDVADDGSLVNGRVLLTGIGGGTIEEGSVDGMECDEFGNVWVTGPGGVWVLNPAGERLGVIRTPEVCGSLCWGGPDLRTLFLTTSTTVHTIPTSCTSAPLPHYELGGSR